MRRRRVLFALTAAGLSAPSVPRAQTAAASWPDRPLRLIVPWPAGGGTDIMARIFTPKLGDILGKPVVIDNRGGASGSIGAVEASRAAPDGYTWMLAFDPEASNQSLMRLPYQLLETFAPITVVSTAPLVLAAGAATPWRSLGDLVAAAKRAPDTIGYATAGVGTLSHISTALLQQVGGFKLVHVPYRGGGPATQAALSGEVPLFMTPVPPANQHIRAGALRPLAVTTEGETRHVPGVRSFAQQGFPGFEAPTWWALLGRAGTPEPILRRMSEAMSATLNSPEVRAKVEEQGADVVGGGPEQTRRFLEGEIEKWGRVIRDNNITVGS
jgi:tripartite-type tricarboxylate transporter receptor subunit TctC